MKTRNYIVMLVLSLLIAISAYAAEEGTKEQTQEPQTAPAVAAPKTEVLKTEMEKISYIIGTQIVNNLRTQEVEVNLDSLIMGLKDALEGNKLVMSQDEMRKVYSAWQTKKKAEIAAKKKKEAAENLAAGTAFLEANKAKEGVKVLPSGLQYKIITEGTGNIPTAKDRVKTHYRGTLIDGTEFDSSYKRNMPAEFGVTKVIKGWTEALQLMKEGAKWELYIPADLAYGQRETPSIPANSTLIFEVELLEIVKPAESADKAKAGQPTVQVK